MRPEVLRCREEIAAIEAEIIAGHPDTAGLCLALSDWWSELRLLNEERRRRESGGAVEGGGCDRVT